MTARNTFDSNTLALSWKAVEHANSELDRPDLTEIERCAARKLLVDTTVLMSSLHHPRICSDCGELENHPHCRYGERPIVSFRNTSGTCEVCGKKADAKVYMGARVEPTEEDILERREVPLCVSVSFWSCRVHAAEADERKVLKGRNL